MRSTIRIVLLTLGLVLTALFFLGDSLVELLWMRELGFGSVFWTILGTQTLLFVLVFALAVTYLGLNFRAFLARIPPLWASRWATEEGEAPQVGSSPLTRKRIGRLAYGAAALVSLLFATGFSVQWDALLRWWYDAPYGMADPIYGHDLSFYVLDLPFVQALQSGFVGLVFLGLLLLVSAYVLFGEIGVQDGRFRTNPRVVRHLAVNVVFLLLGWAWGFYLDRYELLMESSAAVYGAGYTEINVTLPGLWTMFVATLLLATIVAVNLWRYHFRSLAYGVVAYVVTLVAALIIAPAVVEKTIVEPNELEIETPYLEHNIRLTREAFRIDDVEVRSYPAAQSLELQQIRDNESTIKNVRLWDPRLLIDNYQQLQQIRLYYEFYNVDIDRYTIDGEYRQVMLAGRELTQSLPNRSDTWLNRHLQFTHGYGAVANLVAQQGEEGTPNLLVKNLPPEAIPALQVDEPSIYYGEHAPTYKIVNTRAEELHYPKGDQNVYTHYGGTGGVLMDAAWKEVLFAWQFGDFNVVLSDNIQDDSRIQFWQRVQERVSKVAPFLRLDRDPYLVVSANRQYWIQDAYTVSRMFPYSEPSRGGTQYIRNSVKVVVDAYDGDLSFYVADDEDPILRAYQKAFPSLFQPMSAMTDDLRSHLRYPQDLFEMQVEKYRRYHMTIPQVFYNNEDLWTRPREKYRDRAQVMEPYYILTRLPGNEKLEFMLMTPMTPENRDNMIAWMAARSDGADYGELVVYKLPKEKLIYGPNQIESRIDQNTDISRQFSLWDQRGSQVVRGNLIVVPIEESFLYVEPVYLIAEGEVSIPQLRRVIVGYGDQVVMEKTLEGAINAIFGTDVLEPLPTIAERAPGEGGAAADGVPPAIERRVRRTVGQLDEARRLLQEARQALQRGDFATFGARFDDLERTLDEEPAPAADTSAASAPAGGASGNTRE